MADPANAKTSIFSRPSFWVISVVGLVAIIIAGSMGISVASRMKESQDALAKAEMEQDKRLAELSADPIEVNSIYNALNKERVAVGSPGLSTLNNLVVAAETFCANMATEGYFDYTNPQTGRTSNDFIKDNIGDLYFKRYVSSIFSGDPKSSTATETVKEAIKAQSTNLNSPEYNSVGISVCDKPQGNDNPTLGPSKYVVVMLANKQDPPAVQYAPAPRYSAPAYRAPTYCNTTYYDYGGYLNPTASTTCY